MPEVVLPLNRGRDDWAVYRDSELEFRGSEFECRFWLEALREWPREDDLEVTFKFLCDTHPECSYYKPSWIDDIDPALLSALIV